MIQQWELEKARLYSNTELKNMIWLAVDCGQPVPGCMSLESLSTVLKERGEDGKGFHNTEVPVKRIVHR